MLFENSPEKTNRRGRGGCTFGSGCLSFELMLRTFKGSVYFRVNCEKFNIHIRNAVSIYPTHEAFYLRPFVKLIEKASKERYNEGASKVMKAILKATESRQLKMSEIRSGG